MSTLWPSPADLAVASPHQREEYAKATTGTVGVLAGNPGVGKSHVCAQIIKAIIAEHGLSQIAVAAPTGKAAQRINELLLEYRIHNVGATTIHRMLGVTRNGRDMKGWGFAHNSDNPLRKRFIFLDECSMMDTDLWASTLAALPAGTHVLCIGDFAQLPPVGHGAPLRDMIAAGLPYGELSETWRNEGDIVRACRDVKEGRQFTPSESIDVPAGRNLPHIEAARSPIILQKLTALVRNCPATYDPVWDVQVLTAINEKSEVSRKVLNTLLQNILNPDGGRLEGSHFRMGDKVICTRNQMLPVVGCPSCNYPGHDCAVWDVQDKLYVCRECGWDWKVPEMPVDFCANGEIGRVTWLAKGITYVTFDSPARTVRVNQSTINDFDLAYAITTHKAQGSQWPFVVVIADDSRSADRVTSFEWHRTAWSRAQKMCVTIGKLATIHRQCRKSALRDRKTFLTELLKEVV